ncbi:MAG TPA: AraC family transcriptional regulator [Puia sp.]|nr:AraC family transcriptional regulator [Puia sp.]
MKTHFEQVNADAGNSFMCKKIRSHHFDTPYHFHPECELTCITQSEGTRFVGNNFETFMAKDLLLVGRDVPHCWKNENNLEERHEAEAIVIQFKEDFLGKEFFYKPELAKIKALLDRSRKGIVFTGRTKEKAALMMDQMVEADATEKLIPLLQILDLLSKSKEFYVLNAAAAEAKISIEDCERINKIYAYIEEHFRTEILLKDVAGMVYMTPSSFCRYFKKVSRKTLNTLINEYRIELSKQKLISTEESIYAICYDCGFQNISNFNKHFRKNVNLTPSEYRAKFSHYLND